MALFDQLRHEAVQERQHQCVDVRAVDIGIGHDDDLVVAQFGDIEIVVDSGSECRNHRFDLGIGINFIETCFLYIQDFSTQRQDRLRCTASRGFCGTARGISLDQEDLTVFRILVGTVCQFSRQGHTVQCGFFSSGHALFLQPLSHAGKAGTFQRSFLRQPGSAPGTARAECSRYCRLLLSPRCFQVSALSGPRTAAPRF